MAADIEIVDYRAEHKAAFKALNEKWITTYFVMEEADRQALDYPEETILSKEGHILVALSDNVPVGVCALLKMTHSPYDYELVKMAVSPDMQGKGIGYKLGQAVIDRAKELGARTIFLESNSKLAAAVRLYKRLGFKDIPHIETPYARCNVQMAIEL